MDKMFDLMVYVCLIALFFLAVGVLEGICTVVRYIWYRYDQWRYITKQVRENMVEYREQEAEIEKYIRREAGREYRRYNTFEL